MPRTIVGTAGAQIYNYNPKRMGASFENVGATNIWLENSRLEGCTTLNMSYLLTPNDSVDFSLLLDGKDIRLPWSAISEAAGGILVHKEFAGEG